MSDSKIGSLQVMLAGLLWSTMGLFVNRLNEAYGFSPMEMVLARSGITTAVLGLGVLFFRRRLFAVRPADLWCFIGSGCASIVFFSYCLFQAMIQTSTAVAVSLLYTSPVIVCVLSRLFFGEVLTRRKVFAMAGTVLGCALVTGLADGFAGGSLGKLNSAGILFGLGAGIGYALYSIFGRFALRKGYHSVTVSFYTFFFAVLGTLPFVSLGEMGRRLVTESGQLPFLLAFGLITTVIPFLSYTFGLSKISTGKAAVMVAIEPVAAAIWGTLFLREPLTPLAGLGVLLVAVSIIVLQMPETPRLQEKPF
jgi:drug/metabolite transporter (DMT)-like permease